MVGIMKKSTGSIIFILAILSASLCLAGSSMDYPQNTGPSRTDEAIGIDNPAGAWSINRFPYGDILGLIEDGDIPSGIARDTEVVQAFGIHELTYDHTLINTALQPDDVLDEDDFASDSKDYPPSQQSAKAYVDAMASYLQSLIGAASGTTIMEDDSSIDVDDSGTGQIPIVVDSVEIAKATVDGFTTGQPYLATTLSSDDTFEMDNPFIFTAGSSISQWQLVTYSSDSKMDAGSSAAAATRAWGVALAASTDTNPLYVGQHGVGRNDAWSWTPLAVLYLTTAGGMTETAPSGSGNVVQPVGIALTATVVYFDINPVTGWGTAP
jgi:hypothetical protein